MADWSGLPRDLLHLIATKCVESQFDVLHFRSVCPTWRASVPLNLLPPPTHCSSVPWIKKEAFQAFLLKHTIFLFESPTEFSHQAPHFWIGMLQEDECGKKHILNPLRSSKFRPIQYSMVLDISNVHVQELRCEYFQKIVFGYNFPEYSFTERVAYLNDNPNDDDQYRLLVCEDYTGLLHLFKFGDSERSTFELEEGWGHFLDFTQFKGKFYAIDVHGRTMCIDPCLRVSFLEPTASPARDESMFLVESRGNLLLIKWFGTSRDSRELGRLSISLLQRIVFEVFQLDEEMKRWVPLGSLGDGIVFLGGNCNNFFAPAIPGVEGNCIVFSMTRPCNTIRNGCNPLLPKAYVFYLGREVIVDMDERPDLLKLFTPPLIYQQ